MNTAISHNRAALFSTKKCFECLDWLKSTAQNCSENDTTMQANIEKRLLANIPFAMPEPELFLRLAQEGSPAAIVVAKQNHARFLKWRDGQIPDIAKLPADRITMLINNGMEIADMQHGLLHYILADNDPEKLAILLNTSGWASFGSMENFSTLIRECTPELAPVLSNWISEHPDPIRNPGMRALAVYSNDITWTTAGYKCLVYSDRVDPEFTKQMTYTNSLTDCHMVEHLVAKMRSNHGKLEILARFPDTRSILSTPESEFVKLAASLA